MHNLDREAYDLQAEWTQPWLPHSDASRMQQKTIQSLLASAAGAEFGADCFVAADAKVFTHKLVLGDRSWIASGAIIRGNVRIDADCSVNPYAHIAGQVTIGRGCRIASMASIYGFNHGISRTDILSKTSLEPTKASFSTRTSGSAPTLSFSTAWRSDPIAWLPPVPS